MKSMFQLMNFSSKHFSSMMRLKPKVLVLGTGWAGFRFMKGIDQKFWDLNVISPRNHFIFTPLLASTTVGTLEFRAITEPTRLICQKFIQAECRKINTLHKKITCYDPYRNDFFEIDYDYIVIAVGSVPNTFGIPGVKEHCHFLRQVPDARAIRKQIIRCFEEASSPLCTEEDKKKLLSFVIVGGGPTSVEFSAEFHDFLDSDFKRWFPHISINDINITVIESTDHILGMFDEKLSRYAEDRFKRNNIKILTNMSVKEVKKNQIILTNGVILHFSLCVWSTGNTNTDFVNSLNFKKDKKGRILVDNHLQVLGEENIFAIGDCATQEHSNLPQTAQVAQQEGKYLSQLFCKIQRGYSLKFENKFHYEHAGLMSYIGGNKAIINFASGNHNMKGHSAWIFWRSAYLTKLLSIRNKILVPMYWFKAFVFGRDISTF